MPDPVRKAYSLRQTLVASGQETFFSAPHRENHEQRGLLLLEMHCANGQWRRTLEEFLFTDADFAQFRTRGALPRAELRALHRRLVASRHLPLTLDDPYPVQSDLRNTRPETSLASAWPAIALHWPTLTPVFPETPVDTGGTWTGQITISCGAGTFPVRYTATATGFVGDDPLLEITIEDGQQPRFTAGEIEFTFRPQGQWRTRQSAANGSWGRTEGQWAATLHARAPRGEAEILAWDLRFLLEPLPMTFDAETIFPPGWQPVASTGRPSDEPSLPLPGTRLKDEG